MTLELERKLKILALDFCKQCNQFGYRPRKFEHMIADKGVVQAIREVIGTKQIPDGFTRLWERGRLDLSAEALIIERPEFHPLFTPAELATARKRLKDYEGDVRSLCDWETDDDVGRALREQIAQKRKQERADKVIANKVSAKNSSKRAGTYEPSVVVF